MATQRVPAEPLGRRLSSEGGSSVMLLAIGLALVLGTLGYFAVGFGTLTDCTNAYDCTETGCAPCQAAQHWLLAGAVIQGLLAAGGFALLLLSWWRFRNRIVLLLAAVVLAAASLTAFASTKAAADHSFCRSGDSGVDGCA